MIKIEKLRDRIVKILEHQAKDIAVISLENKTVIADYFIIASANSTTQVRSLTEKIEEELSKNGIENQLIEPYKKEVESKSKWNVLDYGAVIVHIFLEETRREYNLEELWGYTG